MNAYLLFAGHHYYPKGGISDFRGDFESTDEAKQFCLDHNKNNEEGYEGVWHWWHIAKRDDLSLVAYGVWLCDNELLTLPNDSFREEL